jgi:hypothetical protein
MVVVGLGDVASFVTKVMNNVSQKAGNFLAGLVSEGLRSTELVRRNQPFLTAYF